MCLKKSTCSISGAGMFSASFSRAQATMSLAVLPPSKSDTESESFFPGAKYLIVG